MDIRPILSSLRRHKTAAALIALQIALTCAIVSNAVFLISERVQNLRTPTGVDESGLIRVEVTGIGRNANPLALTREDLAAIRAIPGVIAASTANQVPLGRSSWNTSVNLTPDQEQPTLNATMYMGGPALLDTLGARVVSGSALPADAFVPFDEAQGFQGLKLSSMLISREFAERAFPGEEAVGRDIYLLDEPVRVVGVVERLARPNRMDGDTGYSMVLPIESPYTVGGNYLVRTTPERRQEVMEAVVAALNANSSGRIILQQQTFEEIRSDFYAQDRTMVWLLAVVCMALLVVTALGIVGLASFWVQQRTRQIGIRRALGATRQQILRYFQVENFLLATVGIALGMLLAFALNQYLMGRYELPRLPLYYLPAGAIVLWLLGQAAVLGPARRAAAVPPAIATRSA
ncbi:MULTISPECIES: ABC transporter permease [unclassified Luteimonas]